MTNEKVSNHSFDQAQSIVILITCGAFPIWLQRDLFESNSAYIYLADRVPTFI